MKRSHSDMNQGALAPADARNATAKVARTTPCKASSISRDDERLKERFGEFKEWHTLFVARVSAMSAKLRNERFQELHDHHLYEELASCTEQDRYEELLKSTTAFLRTELRILDAAEIETTVVALEKQLNAADWDYFIKSAIRIGIPVDADGLGVTIDVATVDLSQLAELGRLASHTKKSAKMSGKRLKNAEKLAALCRVAVESGGEQARYRLLKTLNRSSGKNRSTAQRQYRTLDDVNFYSIAQNGQVTANLKAVCKKIETKICKQAKRKAEARQAAACLLRARQELEKTANNGVYQCERTEGDKCDYFYSVKKRDLVDKPVGFRSWHQC